VTALRVRGWLAYRLHGLADRIWTSPRPVPDDYSYRAELYAQIDDRSPLALRFVPLYLLLRTRGELPVQAVEVPYLPPSVGPVVVDPEANIDTIAERLSQPMPFCAMKFCLVAATFYQATGRVERATYRAVGKFPGGEP
jgi:hypothetical protein